ncbi:branched-chain amino acid ABC transporter permease [Roseateles aquatilis]|uniref:Branched-chain amino acid ABC transporter permease n=1 Tax=Roseateles aquatilis TaxID=431061 RepID=A0A246J8Z9_9BURK|nr:branched-chain amino acid ABC transporter permease [Roseateles aquatilis]OWQ88708.1 branched-chain amino acid ABC transporter permease [Roseateles aquatilis]
MTAHHTLLHHRAGGPWAWALLAALAALPPLLQASGLEFYTVVATRVLIFAMAAASLNLILGFGGLVSFGHAAYVGLGGYTVGVLMDAGVASAWIAWPAAMAVSGLAAAAIGAVCLRTRGVYFIMITLAFAQMFYYLAVSLKAYGGDDGLALPARSTLPVNLADDASFYWVVLALFALVFGALRVLVNSPLGWLLQAAKDNETRVAATGGRVFAVQWSAFIVAGAIAGLAGALLANLNGMVSPHLMHWSQSGQLMVMVIIGGAGAPWGGPIGALVFLLLEEVLSGVTLHWQFALGAILLLVVLFAPRGLVGLVDRFAPVGRGGRRGRQAQEDRGGRHGGRMRPGREGREGGHG